MKRRYRFLAVVSLLVSAVSAASAQEPEDPFLWLEDVDVGFALLEEHMGRGYAREAAEAVVAQGWNVFGLPRIVAITTPDNTRSIRLLESMGFRFVKVFRMPDDDEDLNLYAIDRPGGHSAQPGPAHAPSPR